MRTYRRPDTGAARVRGAGRSCAGVVALAWLVASCSSTPPVGDPVPATEAPRYSLVFIVHGDGDYIFHDTNGQSHRADEAMVTRARAIAEGNKNAEVFVFHQKPRTHTLFVIPRKDGRAYYYRNGRLLEERSYWRDEDAGRFDPEFAIYDELVALWPETPARMFFYFGHEVPEFDGTGYDASYPERPFTIHDLAEALERMAPDSARIDLAVLGTCYGGTPYTINALAPNARFIVASPENLHRSYFDLGPLEDLDALGAVTDARAFARAFAENAFEKLAGDIQTAISVVVYDADEIQRYTAAVEAPYQQALTNLDGRPRGSVEHCDCAREPEYALPNSNDGVTVFYRAPRFGRAKHTASHSGWVCWKTPDVAVSTP